MHALGKFGSGIPKPHSIRTITGIVTVATIMGEMRRTHTRAQQGTIKILKSRRCKYFRNRFYCYDYCRWLVMEAKGPETKDCAASRCRAHLRAEWLWDGRRKGSWEWWATVIYDRLR